MWVEDTDQQKLCKKQRKNKQNLKSQIKLPPPPPPQQQQHKHTNLFTKVQYRLLPSPKKIVQVFCNELMQQLLPLLWDDGGSSLQKCPGLWLLRVSLGRLHSPLNIYLFISRFHVLLLLIGVFVPAIYIYIIIILYYFFPSGSRIYL
jgi:hypothetical protein